MSDAALKSSLLCLGAIILVVGFWSHSLMKMVVTYFMGLSAIAGVFLPDWDFFQRDLSNWTQPVTVNNIHTPPPGSTRFRFYPIRTVVYAAVYGFVLYKWWTYVSQSQ